MTLRRLRGSPRLRRHTRPGRPRRRRLKASAGPHQPRPRLHNPPRCAEKRMRTTLPTDERRPADHQLCLPSSLLTPPRQLLRTSADTEACRRIPRWRLSITDSMPIRPAIRPAGPTLPRHRSATLRPRNRASPNTSLKPAIPRRTEEVLSQHTSPHRRHSNTRHTHRPEAVRSRPASAITSGHRRVTKHRLPISDRKAIAGRLSLPRPPRLLLRTRSRPGAHSILRQNQEHQRRHGLPRHPHPNNTCL